MKLYQIARARILARMPSLKVAVSPGEKRGGCSDWANSTRNRLKTETTTVLSSISANSFPKQTLIPA